MLIKDASILKDGCFLRDVNITIEGSRVTGIGPGIKDMSGDDEVIDASVRGKLAQMAGALKL